MPNKTAAEMETLKVPTKIQKMDSPLPLKDSVSESSSGGLGYQNTLVSKK